MTNSYIIQSKKGNGTSGDEALTHAQMDINLGFLVPTGFILPYAGKLSTQSGHTTQFTYLNSTHADGKAIHRLPGDTTTQLAWLLCDGSVYSKLEYQNLFDRIGHVYSDTTLVSNAGGSTDYFCVPDLRGQFIRGWDNGSGTDPNAGARTASADLSGQFVSGDNVGTKQASENKAHTHTVDAAQSIGGNTDDGSAPDERSTTQTRTTSSTGGTESRPTNIALAYFIKT